MNYKTDNVFEAVWVGCAVLAYLRYSALTSQGKKIDKDSFWFSQAEIANSAQALCTKTVQNARISQWTNGDHSNGSYNYLRQNGPLRRLTDHGEFKGVKEFPPDLVAKRQLRLTLPTDQRLSIGDLIDWFRQYYSPLFSAKPENQRPILGVDKVRSVQSNNAKNVSLNQVNRVYNNGTIHLNIKALLAEFLKLIGQGHIEVYNEFSVQFELAMFLRARLSDEYKIQLERNMSFFNLQKNGFLKKEMDIVVFNKTRREKYCIELKYPLNGQYPEQMFSICRDISFLEQLQEAGFTRCFELVIVNSSVFYSDKGGGEIYEMFRKNKTLKGRITKPTGLQDEELILAGEYKLDWVDLSGNSRGLIVVV